MLRSRIVVVTPPYQECLCRSTVIWISEFVVWLRQTSVCRQQIVCYESLVLLRVVFNLRSRWLGLNWVANTSLECRSEKLVISMVSKHCPSPLPVPQPNNCHFKSSHLPGIYHWRHELGKCRLCRQNPCSPQHFCEIFKEFTMLFICFIHGCKLTKSLCGMQYFLLIFQ